MKKTISILLGVVLVLGLRLAVPGSMVAEDRIIHVPGDHPTIQEAIDAARDGDTISVASGEHGAFSVIGKANIVISGDHGATVIAGDSVPINRGPIGEAWCMAVVKDSHDISIQGIGFDGSALGREEVVVGIAYIDSTGKVADLTVEKIVGVQLGAGVVIIGDAETSDVSLKDVAVRGATVGVVISAARASLDSCTFTAMVPGAGFGIIPMPIGIGVLVGLPDEQTVATQSELGGYGSPPAPYYTRVQMGGSTVSRSDIGMLVIDDSIVEAHFNRIVDNVWFGLRNDGGQAVNAQNNWWGDISGPFHPTENPTGRGNAVSNDVDFRPWLRANVGAVKTERVDGSGTVNAMAEADTEVVVQGTATVTVAKYASDPLDGPPTEAKSLQKYIDVYVPDTGQVTEIEIRIYYYDEEVFEEQGLLRIFWWNGAEWEACSYIGVNTTSTNGYSGYAWARINLNTRPSLTDLTGTEMDVREGPRPPPPPPCAIATSAYGTDKAQEIQILREFRDAVLLPNELGAAFVALYYRTSPAVAGFIFRYEILRATVRVGVIDRIVAVLNWSRAWWSVTGR